MSKDNHKQKQTVQTTGHAWDGDIQEFNNPIPTWWLWGFYLTVVFAVVYWVFFPAWPIGDGYTKGIGNEIEYTTKDGKKVTTHWNTRALLQKELMDARLAQQTKIEELNKASYEEIMNDPDKRGFVFSVAKVLFSDNCAACHQAGGAGLAGRYPNLADDSWIWGGKFEHIQMSIRDGRNGSMPGFAARLSGDQIANVSEYVLSLSGNKVEADKVKRGKVIFEGDGGCVACHTKAATGNIAMGSANLTDQIWTVAKIGSGMSLGEKKAEIQNIIKNGISRKMPAWSKRFSDTELKMLAMYVHQLGGGQ